MPRSHPYLQRRGGHYFFRIAVPIALRESVGTREITKTLNTGDRHAAVPLALELGAVAKHLFRVLTTPMKSDDRLKVLQRAREKLQLDAIRADHEQELEDANSRRVAALTEAQRARDVEQRIAQARIETLERALAIAQDARLAREPLPSAEPENSGKQVPHITPPVLAVVIDDFLTRYPKGQKPGMYKKHVAALAALKAVLGGKSVNQLRQSHLVEWFDLVERLPTRWAEKCKKSAIGLADLAAEEHASTLSKKTFTDNYLNPVALFMKWARTRWQDQGFPIALTTEGIEFTGEDDEGKNRQRAFRPDELERLFHGELLKFKGDEGQAHKWWLPVLAFYTGARVNELCQLNPSTDVLVTEGGIHYLLISEDTEGDSRVRKSVKTGVKRLVPLHAELTEGGFLQYVHRVRESGSKLLFPAWSPTNLKASTQAERWFRDLLRATGLRDETPGERVVGFHAFRHTLLAMALNSDPSVDAGPLTGHANPSKSAVQRDYEGPLALENKLKLLRSIQFTFKP